MLPELLASHAVQGASPTLALAACSLGLALPPLWPGWAGYSQVNLNHHTWDPCLLSRVGLHLYWKYLSLLLFHFLSLMMDFYTPFQKTKQIVCLTSPRISGPGVAWEGKHSYYSCGQTFLGISKEILDWLTLFRFPHCIKLKKKAPL